MRCRKARHLISLYLAPRGPWLSPQDRQTLATHMAVCEACRRDYEESQKLVLLLQRHWQISEDTQALLWKSQQQEQREPFSEALRRHGSFNRVAAWVMVTAACLVIGMLGWWAIPNGRTYVTEPKSPVASSEGDGYLTIESTDGGRITPGAAIQTSVGEIRSLVLNSRHRVVMNAGTSLSIEPLVEKGRTGCLVRLALGEVYVHVEHDGRPFVVQTTQGKAVITGTTFDVKVTEARTSLMVVEGSVRFESEGEAVEVIAGQQSMIAGTLAPPSKPTACDAVALTVWAHPADQRWQIAEDVRPGDFLSDDLPAVRPPWAEVRTDLDRLDYAQWMEQKRVWFRQQFPWAFELKDSLSKEGVEVDYPALLMQSGDLWRFGYPQAGMGRQVEPDPNGLLGAVSHYDRDGSWLQQQALPSLRATGHPPQRVGAEAFERWAKTIQAQADLCPPKVDSGTLLDTVNACLYLVNTRTLALLTIRNGFAGTPPQVTDEVLALLQEEFQTLAQCVELSYGLDSAKPNAGTCENQERLNTLIDGVRRVGELEKRVKEYEKGFRQ